MDQSAMVYCESKQHGKISRLLNYYIKAIDNKFLRFIGMITARDVERTLEEFVNHSPAARDLRILLVFYQHPVRFISL